MKSRITIGIPCYQNVSFETLGDYMRFAFHLGRRYQEYEFFLAIKGKSEQFRARNAIVKQALQTDSDYILMLDDDHVLDIQNSDGPSEGYEFLRTLLDNFEKTPDMGICGALYSQRGGDYYPVVMTETKRGSRFLTMAEISGKLQKVDITGGGCMLIKMDIFRRLEAPWFAPEFEAGTDVQICRKARDIGYSVWCDTSIEIGHVRLERDIVVPSKAIMKKSDISKEQLKGIETADNYVSNYIDDVVEYTDKSVRQLEVLADSYVAKDIETFEGSMVEYYKTRGVKQLARNALFNCSEGKVAQSLAIIKSLEDPKYAYGLDYCCGSAPVGFELLKSGKRMDFIDIDGAGSYEFLKWRARNSPPIGQDIEGPYDFVLMLDAIEHLQPWELHLIEIDAALKIGGLLVTNYFTLYDYDNPEHINMEKYKVEAFLVERGYKAINPNVWIKE